MSYGSFPVKTKEQLNQISFDEIEESSEWATDSGFVEKQMHKIHLYPAKFPAFIANKAFDYMHKHKRKIKNVADVFCGCGTVALECRLQGYDFLGFDINPVAVLISKAKSGRYSVPEFRKYKKRVLNTMRNISLPIEYYAQLNPRLKYWFNQNQAESLFKIKTAIFEQVKNDTYKTFFLCVFSSILKRTSRWLAKSIKPQIDPQKKDVDPFCIFSLQCGLAEKALIQENHVGQKCHIDIKEENFLDSVDENVADLIVTSPPYVTSYEYADLHQLSSLWLGFANDYHALRKDTIGSLYLGTEKASYFDYLSGCGRQMVEELRIKKYDKLDSVTKYFFDMDKAIARCSALLKPRGTIFLVIGDTKYSGVKITNGKYLCECLLSHGFIIEMIAKRKLSHKNLSPFRGADGKFSSDVKSDRVYAQEFVIIGRKNNGKK